MPTYRIVFRNGEKRNLVLEAEHIQLPKSGVYRFYADDDERRLIAIVPESQVLYIVEDKECSE